MNRQEKETFVSELRARVERAPVFYLTDFTGLDVPSITVLRARLKESGAEYVVVKNRLAKRAFQDLDEWPDITEHLMGPTGMVFGYEGPVEPAKTLAEFARDHEDRPAWKAGVLDKELLAPEQIERLAELPPREQLLSQLLGALQGPMSALAGAMGGKVQEMAGLLEALRQEQDES